MSPRGSRTRIVVVGAGGHAAVVIEALLSIGDYEVVGLVDPAPPAPRVLDLPVLGGDDALRSLRAEGIPAAALGLGNNAVRARVAAQLSSLGYMLPAIIHPSALVAPSARIEAGAVIMARAVVGTRTCVGLGAIVNTGAIIDHDGNLGGAAHIAPGTAVAGTVQIGARALVGVGACVRPGITIGVDAVVGAGSAVVSDVAPGTVVAGTPARPLHRKDNT